MEVLPSMKSFGLILHLHIITYDVHEEHSFDIKKRNQYLTSAFKGGPSDRGTKILQNF